MHFSMNRTTVGALLAALMLYGCDPLPSPQPESAPEHRSTHSRHRHHPKHRQRADEGTKRRAADIPEKATKVLRYIDEHHRAPEGYEGGRDFHNAGASGHRGLPKTDANGKAITYREWDVNPKERGVNRGAERLVTGSDGSAYYTDDHYRTFERVR
jgi:ribonuclease T1